MSMATIIRQQRHTDGAGYRALVGLYGVRQRLQVARFKAETKRDAAALRRQLRGLLAGEPRRR